VFKYIKNFKSRHFIYKYQKNLPAIFHSPSCDYFMNKKHQNSQNSVKIQSKMVKNGQNCVKNSQKTVENSQK
jgi:hypothetical protein